MVTESPAGICPRESTRRKSLGTHERVLKDVVELGVFVTD